MSAMQRRKGATAERELFGLLSERLGTVVKRNLSQTRGGGADTLDISGWSLEVKRQETGFREAWWEQAVEQARKADRKPALAYRASRQPWRFRTDLTYSDPLQIGSGYWVETDIDGFCFMVRETI